MTRPDEQMPKGGLLLSLDDTAKSADARLPAFLARPDDAPVYHGFTVLEGVEADGFRLGTITALGPADFGDAFVVAPDDSRAGLIWELGSSRELREVSGFEPGRWGVWGVKFARPMQSTEDAQRNLEDFLPALRAKWQEWKARSG